MAGGLGGGSGKRSEFGRVVVFKLDDAEAIRAYLVKQAKASS